MSRSGYTEDEDYDGQLAMWRGQVANSIRGKRGQAFLRDLIDALDAMPEKRLIVGVLKTSDGEVCALGALGLKRGIEMHNIDVECPHDVAAAFNITHQLASETQYYNDEVNDFKWVDGILVAVTPEERWANMRAWATKHLKDMALLNRSAEV